MKIKWTQGGSCVNEMFEQFIGQTIEFDTVEVIENQIDIFFEIIVQILEQDIGAAGQVKWADTSFIEDIGQLRGGKFRKVGTKIHEQRGKQEDRIGIFRANLIPDICVVIDSLRN